jgi:hypothetical protein
MRLEKTSPLFRKTARLARNDVLVLTEDGKPAFALVRVRDEMALEAFALSRNTEFMTYLDEVSQRKKGERTYSLKEIEEEFSRPTGNNKRKSERKDTKT